MRRLTMSYVGCATLVPPVPGADGGVQYPWNSSTEHNVFVPERWLHFALELDESQAIAVYFWITFQSPRKLPVS